MIGRTISHFQISEKLGGGGMGVVYKAKDIRLDRTVALKFLPSYLSNDPEANERFIAEAKAASALDHPHICTIYDIGESEEGQLFIAMAYYEGQTLKKKIAEGALLIEEAVDLAVQTAEGLTRAHEAGIVHRDIKPANVMVTDRGKVKIVDFGLAKMAGQHLTQEGSVLGTAAYMSPEQARGEATDHRTDVWSLGAVLYEMLTGQRPFPGDYEQAIIYSVLNVDAEPVHELRPEVSEVLSGIINRALEKEAEARYGSMAEMLEALKGCQASLQPTNGVDIKALIRQPRVWVPALALLIALGTLGGWMMNQRSDVQWAREEAIPEIERLAEAEDYEEAYALAVQAEAFIPEDPTLQRLLSQTSIFVPLLLNPPGIEVSWKPYAQPDTAWISLGTTPMDSVRIPRGFKRFRLEKTGYQALEIAISSALFHLFGSFALPEKGRIPEDMVPIAAPAREIWLPGLEYLAPEPVSLFLIDRYEVTNAAFKRFVESDGYEDPTYWKEPFIKEGQTLYFDEAMALFVDQTGRPGPATWEVGDFPEGEDDYPVKGISWYEAAAYAEFAGKSLPTVFHWNLAATTAASSYIVPLSNFDDQGPAPVGQYEGISVFGVYDIAGNVREWIWNETSRDAQRFILGGAWDDPTWMFNDAHARPPFDRSPQNGFRCIMYLAPNENQDSLTRTIEQAFRDYSLEVPVDDATFAHYLRQFVYDDTPLNAEVVEIDDSNENWIKEKITFDAAYGDERVMAYLFLPKRGTPPYQTVVYFPGSNAIHSRSSETDLELDRLTFLMQDGRAVIYPIYKSTYERGDDLNSDYQDESVFYKEHVIMWAKDLSRSIDYLETREEINTEKLAYYGASWGGVKGPIMLVAEPRLKAAIFRGAGLEFNKVLPEVDPFNYLSRVQVPVLILNGRYDFFFPEETSQKYLIEGLSTPEADKVLRNYETGHFVPEAQRIKESLAWLDKYLGPVR